MENRLKEALESSEPVEDFPAVKDLAEKEPPVTTDLSSCSGEDGESSQFGCRGRTKADSEEIEQIVGRVLAGRYKITRRIGEGGFGAVFEAEDTKIKKTVALKLLVRSLISESSILARFRQEAESAGKVGHENIVDITDFDRTVDGHYFMVMEYLNGVNLGSVIQSGEAISVVRILSIMIQVCGALYATHEKGIVHRDLKPGNIFLTVRGSRTDFVKILDFGISKLMEVDEKTSRLTKTGQIIGTPLYMAPEQAAGEGGLDHRVDIYSLGVIMYELVTGHPPFTAFNYLGIIAQHASDPPTPPSKIRPDLEIPSSVERIILKAMAKRPEDRFASMREMEESLVQALATIDPTVAISYSPDQAPSLLTDQADLSQLRVASQISFPFWGGLAGAAVIGLLVALWDALPFGGSDQPKIKPADAVPLVLAPKPAPDLRVRGEINASSRGARLARHEEGETIDVFNRRVTPPGGMDRPPNSVVISRQALRVRPEINASNRGGRPTPKSSDPAAEVSKVLLTIDSKPSKAIVLDAHKKKLGYTPFRTKVKQSDQKLTLYLKRRGYKLATLVVVPTSKRREIVVLKRRYSGHIPDDPKGWW